MLDWHNFGYTLMGMSMGKRHWLVSPHASWDPRRGGGGGGEQPSCIVDILGTSDCSPCIWAAFMNCPHHAAGPLKGGPRSTLGPGVGGGGGGGGWEVVMLSQSLQPSLWLRLGCDSGNAWQYTAL